MAAVCECCKKRNNSFAGDAFDIGDNKILCYKCAAPVRNTLNDLYYAKNRSEFEKLQETISNKCKENYSSSITASIMRIVNQRRAEHNFPTAEQEKKLFEEEKECQENLASLIMTTGSFFDGYKVEKYIDVICQEIVFRNGIRKRFDAAIEDLNSVLSFEQSEMAGTTELITNAREYVTKKFKMKAAQMGANAVLGVEFESSFGADIVRVAVFGTAVKIKKEF